jgi:hypothetical protein
MSSESIRYSYTTLLLPSNMQCDRTLMWGSLAKFLTSITLFLKIDFRFYFTRGRTKKYVIRRCHAMHGFPTTLSPRGRELILVTATYDDIVYVTVLLFSTVLWSTVLNYCTVNHKTMGIFLLGDDDKTGSLLEFRARASKRGHNFFLYKK